MHFHYKSVKDAIFNGQWDTLELQEMRGWHCHYYHYIMYIQGHAAWEWEKPEEFLFPRLIGCRENIHNNIKVI